MTPRKKPTEILSHETEKTLSELPIKKQKTIESLTDRQINEIAGLIEAIESSGLDEFMEYIRSPWRMLWPNFVAGVARGIGALIGAALVITAIGWILSSLIDIPLIGKRIEPYIQNVQTEINRYVESTNYTKHFENIESSLQSIDENLKKQP